LREKHKNGIESDIYPMQPKCLKKFPNGRVKSNQNTSFHIFMLLSLMHIHS